MQGLDFFGSCLAPGRARANLKSSISNPQAPYPQDAAPVVVGVNPCLGNPGLQNGLTESYSFIVIHSPMPILCEDHLLEIRRREALLLKANLMERCQILSHRHQTHIHLILEPT